MRVLGVLVAWGVLAVLATMCFAVGGSLGYRRGVRDTVAQIRDRRTGKTGCRPLPANHLRRRTSGHARPGARARRSRWHVGPGSARRPTARREPVHLGRVPTAAVASVAALLLIGVPGTAIGATTAQPGESLWKVKLGLEQVRLALATTPERGAEVHVDLASVRLTELEGLVDDDPAPAVVGDVAEDLEDHARAARKRLTDVQAPTVRTQLHRRLVAVTAGPVAVLDELLESDCMSDLGGNDCLALAETRDSMVELQDDSAGDALALNDSAPVTASPAPTPPTTVQAEPVPSTVDEPATQPAPAAATGDLADDASAPTASAAPSAVPSPKPSVAASTAASAAPTPTPTPTASTAPPPSGSPATEATVDPASDGKDGSGDGGSAGGTAATAADSRAE